MEPPLDSRWVDDLSLLLVEEVKRTFRRGRTRISRKHQATIPVEALRRAGLKPGDELVVEAAGAGRILLVRADDVLRRHAGSLTGVYPEDYLEQLRGEWK
ncbi:MAG TPA: AbrB/MazE/SpoVT family DNA-binding domain-containing protein [Chloroflexota bacterium]|nr:AbrB/MazE/SpoVT family DNA-binding domain-containing protein [Chloroflexota bacterium]